MNEKPFETKLLEKITLPQRTLHDFQVILEVIASKEAIAFDVGCFIDCCIREQFFNNDTDHAVRAHANAKDYRRYCYARLRQLEEN